MKIPDGDSKDGLVSSRLNQKGIRPQDRPISFQYLMETERQLILNKYPELG